jgi:hypothetical protein
MQHTNEELVVGLTSQLERAQARIAEREARLGRDSRSFSIPPGVEHLTDRDGEGALTCEPDALLGVHILFRGRAPV